jgi:hypothetical protein
MIAMEEKGEADALPEDPSPAFPAWEKVESFD